jgi:hypothetical protein
MVFCPRQPKTALSTTTTTATAASISRVVSPPTHEPIVFNDVNRYKAWHSAMSEEIQALRANKTWTLVSFHPSMIVVGSRWVYKVKRRVNGSIKRYKTRLVAKDFT